jgi:hypothetical protein
MSYLKAVWTLPTYLRRSIIGHNVNKSFVLSLSPSVSVSVSLPSSHHISLLLSSHPFLSRTLSYSTIGVHTNHPTRPSHSYTRHPCHPIQRLSHPVFTINYIILIVSLATWRSCFESVHARQLTLPRTPFMLPLSYHPP